MKFTYETQGAVTYLVCELDPMEQVDSLTLGMLTNNHINGVAPVLYTEMNGCRFLKYNVSAKVTGDQFFGGKMNRQRALTTFKNILNVICSADDYMIEPNCFSVLPEHIFLNVSSCETALICVPVMNSRNINAEVAGLFKKILFSTQFDQSEDAGYITQLITSVNDVAGFTVYNFRDLVQRLLVGEAPRAAAPVVPVPAGNDVFNGTIAMDDMLAMGEQKQNPVAPVLNPQPPVNSAPAPQPQIPVPQPQQPVTPQVKPQPQTAPPVRPVVPQRPPINPAPPQNPGWNQHAQTQGQVPPVTNTMGRGGNQKQPPVPGNAGFAIPGQSGTIPVPNQPGRSTPGSVPVPTPGANPAPAQGDKKMSWFGLMSHYNKENAAIYKAQKEAEKEAKKAGKQKPVPVQPPVNQQIPGQPPMPGQQPIHGQNGQWQPGGMPQQYPPQPVRPVPIQNSFNETTVLSPAMMSGETTVLSGAAAAPQPMLTRVKTGERIVINKPVFRIGKEKSYVDYFIGDNTAISRSHANIHTENGNYFVEDTNSTNHTYVNGQIITSSVKTKLASGDKVRLANEDFIFSI